MVAEELRKSGLNIENLDGIKVVPYIYELQEVMSACEIMLCRSGAITITEIANLGKPSILVPLPNVSHDHQQYNAEVLENLEAAKIIKNNELSAERLNKEITEILSKDLIQKMGENAKKASIANVQDKIYKEIKELLEGNSSK